jgi:hypothetical protein
MDKVKPNPQESVADNNSQEPRRTLKRKASGILHKVYGIGYKKISDNRSDVN